MCTVIGVLPQGPVTLKTSGEDPGERVELVLTIPGRAVDDSPCTQEQAEGLPSGPLPGMQRIRLSTRQ